jgi:hypothetical protein
MMGVEKKPVDKPTIQPTNLTNLSSRFFSVEFVSQLPFFSLHLAPQRRHAFFVLRLLLVRPFRKRPQRLLVNLTKAKHLVWVG